MRPMGQEPTSCFCSVRQLDVQVHPLDMTLVCRRDLPPIQPLMLSAKQGGIGSHFYSLWYDPTGNRTPISQSQGGHSNHKATELVNKYIFKYICSNAPAISYYWSMLRYMYRPIYGYGYIYIHISRWNTGRCCIVHELNTLNWSGLQGCSGLR